MLPGRNRRWCCRHGCGTAARTRYDHGEVGYLDGTFRYFASQAQRNIDVALDGPAAMRNLLSVFYRRANAYSRNTGSTVADPKALRSSR